MREAGADLASAKQGLPSTRSLLRASLGIAVVFALFYLWLHEGYLAESMFFSVTLGLVLSGAVVPRRHDDSDAIMLKRTITASCVSGAVVMVFTLSMVAASIGGVLLGLVLSGFYQLISDVGDAGKYARKRMRDDEAE